MTDPRRLVDPELLALVDMWQEVALDETTLPLMRVPGRLPIAETVDPARVEQREVVVPGPAGAPDVTLIVYRPAARAGVMLPCIYHIHGGGFVGGDAAGLEPYHRALVDALDCVLVTVEYRLAPETPFPGPLDDCHAGLVWVAANSMRLGIDADRLGVMGESAGGGLAAGLALLARDRGGPRLAFQHLVYPMLDDRTCIAEPHPHTGAFIWTTASNAFGWRSYLGVAPGAPTVSPYAAPARAQDLAGLPPTFIAAGALDLFVEEDVAYATALVRAGVPTELHVYPGAFHGFDIAQSAGVSRRMRRDSWDCLSRRLRGLGYQISDESQPEALTDPA